MLSKILSLFKRDDSSRIMEAIDAFNGESSEARLKSVLNDDEGCEVRFSAKGKDNWTPLLYACRYGSIAVINTLLDMGADPKSETELGKGALYWFACNEGGFKERFSSQLICRLKEMGNDIDHQDGSGRTALFMACSKASTGIVPLIECGANVNILENDGLSAVHAAIAGAGRNCGEEEAIRIIGILVEHGADLNTVHLADGTTPIFAACELDFAELVSYLLENGADSSCRSSNGMTALDYAYTVESFDSAAILARKGALYSEEVISKEDFTELSEQGE